MEVFRLDVIQATPSLRCFSVNTLKYIHLCDYLCIYLNVVACKKLNKCLAVKNNLLGCCSILEKNLHQRGARNKICSHYSSYRGKYKFYFSVMSGQKLQEHCNYYGTITECCNKIATQQEFCNVL